MLTGRQISDPSATHIDIQSQRYADGAFKDLAYYSEDVKKRAKLIYHLGDNTQ
ncbi:hypothetical protein [Lacinutrix jangbogonensis]|uniref:hypothetical protein n=1 Tax=Lacinutrix jangbogonensis TaxID=1469557 RepID=UPI0012E001F5|nr:hypothetical protein [Lacinutrix jangbogonensis]